ncbi:MAG: hypoxanthine phosphoribosyltransferase [Anaerolineae bacterium]|nr:hypoxanthine phosphoribosyltransferase [Thermoflexales bacterium]MDW8406520.1 hypoxanthine phosphoribosyltransferase [Anaerolineae bacterium]
MTRPLPEGYAWLSDEIQEVLFSAEMLQRRVAELGSAISIDYAGRNPLLVGVLKGVLPFMADLLRAITIHVEVDFIAVSSYTPEARERGIVRLVKDLEMPLAGRHVLFVEDVIDTGLTLSYLLRNLRARQPASLEVCALFDKPAHRLIGIPLKYKGFDLPDRFVVGYGLDYHERYRNLPFVALLRAQVLG